MTFLSHSNLNFLLNAIMMFNVCNEPRMSSITSKNVFWFCNEKGYESVHLQNAYDNLMPKAFYLSFSKNDFAFLTKIFIIQVITTHLRTS